ncbi:MAG TPA: hypothetical protein VGI74_15840 [Streptosporangiaceae bacterium]
MAVAVEDVGSLSFGEQSLTDTEVTVIDAPIVTVGGGLGSFAVADFLRISGVPKSDIRVIAPLSIPYATFAERAAASQLGALDRLRSDSMSRIDNIWGWPSYALSEALAERTVAPLLKVLTEPLMSEFFTPHVQTVLAGIDREARRIGWDDMVVTAWAQVVRRRTEGGYFVLTRPIVPGGQPVVYRTNYVHLALGYPSMRSLPDFTEFRRCCDAPGRMINAYEVHEEVYDQLVQSPGRVLLRGSGIAACRILERLIDDRERRGASTEIVHLFRHYVDGAAGSLFFRRRGGHGFAYQPFSFPKAAGGGQLRARMLALPADERARLVMRMGGTTTPRRRRWQRQLAGGRREGWYQARSGALLDVKLSPGQRLAAKLRTDDGTDLEFDVDFMIDATGLEDDIRLHTLLVDLLLSGGARINALGKLDVAATFEVCGTRSGSSRLYASGAATLGGQLAPVDSFWGLTHAALEICDDLASQGVCEFLGGMRSISQWWRWIRNLEP